MSEFRIDCRHCEFETTEPTHGEAVDRGLEHSKTTGHLPRVIDGGQ